MAQGTIKSSKLSSATAKNSSRRQAVLGPKKGARTIAPRKQVLVRNKGMVKVLSFALFHIKLPFWYSFGEGANTNSGATETLRGPNSDDGTNSGCESRAFGVIEGREEE